MNYEKINIFDSMPELCKSFTSMLKALTEASEHINVALSGGTTPNALFSYWVENCREAIDWKCISFYWGDERCVAPDDVMSNYGTANKYLFSKVPEIQKENIHRIFGENNPEDEAVRYGKEMAENLPLKNGIPEFDLIMLGMGDDGHTASIFPYCIDLWNAPENCVVAAHPETGMKRVSFTGRVINNAKNVAFLVTGEKKTDKVKAIIGDRKNGRSLYPAALVNPEDGDLLWYLDRKAAMLL